MREARLIQIGQIQKEIMETYSLNVCCSNCNFNGMANLPKGNLVTACECQTCGCVTLRRSTQVDDLGNGWSRTVVHGQYDRARDVVIQDMIRDGDQRRSQLELERAANIAMAEEIALEMALAGIPMTEIDVPVRGESTPVLIGASLRRQNDALREEIAQAMGDVAINTGVSETNPESPMDSDMDSDFDVLLEAVAQVVGDVAINVGVPETAAERPGGGK